MQVISPLMPWRQEPLLVLTFPAVYSSWHSSSRCHCGLNVCIISQISSFTFVFSTLMSKYWNPAIVPVRVFPGVSLRCVSSARVTAYMAGTCDVELVQLDCFTTPTCTTPWQECGNTQSSLEDQGSIQGKTRLKIKTVFLMYRDSHVNDKTVARPSYL